MTQIKALLNNMLIGFIAIAALGMGFIVMVAGILFLPVIKWWALRKLDKKVDVVKTGDVIEVEYEVVGEDKDK